MFPSIRRISRELPTAGSTESTEVLQFRSRPESKKLEGSSILYVLRIYLLKPVDSNIYNTVNTLVNMR